MKRRLARILCVAVLISSSFNFVQTGSPVDTVSAASVWVEEPVAAPARPAPAPVRTAAPAPARPAAVTSPRIASADGIYIVQNGDMMWKIAASFNMKLEDLIALNPQLENPNMIYIGDQIHIRKAEAVTEASAPAAMPTTAPAAPAPAQVKIYQGLGHTVAFRNGPGKDSEEVPVYSFNIAMADATFDEQGRILSVYIDGYEVATPNYDGASMPHFSGWPGKEGYNVSDHESGLVTGISENTPESAAAEVNAWLTKRQRGDSYHMNPNNEWYQQMDFFQSFFKGKTVAELEDWFSKYTTAAGRPIKADTTDPADMEKLANMTEAEKAQLADVVSGATMSVRDAHGDFLGAIGEAYKNRQEVVVPVQR